MNEQHYEDKEIKLDDLVPFRLRTSQLYQGDRLEQLANSIKNKKLFYPIIVRPIGDGKYEIICGHNRANAMKMLGRDTIRAEIREDLSDEEAIELFYDSNLNQQSFSDWNYSQKIKAIQYIDTLVKENSHQGKRSDLVKQEVTTEEETSVHSRHKLDGASRRSTTRDRMSRRLGIATATFSKYRKISRLPDDLPEIMGKMLDEKKFSLEAAYRMSGLSHQDIRWLIEYVEKSPDKKIDLARLKELAVRGKAPGTLPVIAKELMESILVPKDPS